jgi:hypothetical protein
MDRRNAECITLFAMERVVVEDSFKAINYNQTRRTMPSDEEGYDSANDDKIGPGRTISHEEEPISRIFAGAVTSLEVPSRHRATRR